jgi:hypothetical protein
MDTPIACQLGVFSADERYRYEAVRGQIEAAVGGVAETANGYVFDLPGNDATLALVADWIAFERRCCPFLEFAVSIGASHSPIRVALTGSPEVKKFLESEFRSGVVSPSALVRRGGI